MQTRSRFRLPTRGWLVAAAACLGLTFAGAGGLGQLISSVEQEDLDVASAALEDRLSQTGADVAFFGAAVGTVLAGVEDPSEVTSFLTSMAGQSSQSSTLSSGAVEALALHRAHDGESRLPDLILPLGFNLAAMSDVSQPLAVDSFAGPRLNSRSGDGSVRYVLTVPVARPDGSYDVLAAALNPSALIREAVAEAGDGYLSVTVTDVTEDMIRVTSVNDPSRLHPSTSASLSLFGREWNVDVRPGPNYPVSGVRPAMLTTFAFGSVAVILLVVAGLLDRRRREHLQQELELAEELVQSKDRFIASVSHELRTPLTAVRGFAELMSGMLDDVAQDIREMAQAIADQSGEMSYLIDDLLVAARAEVGAVSVLHEVVDTGEVIRRLLGSLPYGAEVEFIEPPEPLSVVGDRHRVRQILHNLVANAHRYGGDRIRIEVAHERQTVLNVLDDGPAIPWEAQQQMFAPYQQLSVSTTQPASVGLGLTVARELARLMGGDLEYHRRDRWNVFALSLPAAPATPLARAG